MTNPSPRIRTSSRRPRRANATAKSAVAATAGGDENGGTALEGSGDVEETEVESTKGTIWNYEMR